MRIRLNPLGLILIYLYLAINQTVALGVLRTPPVDRLLPSDSSDISARWGAYTVSYAHPDFEQSTVRIRDGKGRIIREIDCAECYDLYIQQINGMGKPELVIVAKNIVNLGSSVRTYVYTQDGGLRNLTIITGGGGEFQKLDHGADLFVMQQSGLLESAGTYCHGYSPAMPLVIGWSKGKAVDESSKYSWLERFYGRKYRRELYRAIAQYDSRAGSWDRIMASAAGYYGSACELGHGIGVYQQILHALPSHELRSDFIGDAHEVRRRIALIPKLISQDQRHTIVTPNDSVF